LLLIFLDAAEKLALALNAQKTTVVTWFYYSCSDKNDYLWDAVVEYKCRNVRYYSCTGKNKSDVPIFVIEYNCRIVRRHSCIVHSGWFCCTLLEYNCSNVKLQHVLYMKKRANIKSNQIIYLVKQIQRHWQNE